MIKDKLIPKLKAAFPKLDIAFDHKHNPVAVLPASHPDVGDVRIHDDEDEATVFIGDLTHRHFNPYDRTLTQEEIDSIVSDEVVDFLYALVHDRVLLWKTDQGGGGCTLIESEKNLDKIIANNRSYLWSGPVTSRGEGA